MADPDQPRAATVPDRFALVAAADSDAIALVEGDVTMSYAALDAAADRLARVLVGHGVGTDDAVAVAIPRGVDLIVAMLGIVKAGAAYVPLDLDHPAARTALVVAAGRCRVVVTSTRSRPGLPPLDGIRVVSVDAEPPAAVIAPAAPTGPAGTAAVLFTSGSTGVPKGVAIPHRGVLRLVDTYRFGPGERVMHLAAATFDASTLEVWGALLTGATLVIIPAGPLDLANLAERLRGGDITVAFLTTGLFHQLVAADVASLAAVGALLTGGEVLSPEAARAALRVRSGKPLINVYGPTENSTVTTEYTMTDPDGITGAIPIGTPIRGTGVRILDPDGHPVPDGEPGELYAGGDGLARGYIGDAAKTAAAFVPDPDGDGARLYRTGDIARRRPDGVLEFLGRVDDQVKIRGFRIEPGEVESALRAHPAVRDAVVVVRGDAEHRHLVGYVAAPGGIDAATGGDEVRAFLAARLPAHLVPTGIVVLPALPLNASGKVDRSALPEPTHASSAPPETPTERRLAVLWTQILSSGERAPDAAGRDDNFFATGGNSLTAAHLMFRVREVFDVELALGDFYDAATIRACAARIDAAAPGATAGTGIARRDRSAHRIAVGPS